jgi:uncharacterized membrane protein YraQ (UPF0718 family)
MRSGLMEWKREGRTLSIFLLVFLGAYFMPLESSRLGTSVIEALILLKLYAREHVLTCLIPAFFIAGGISVFLSQAAVMRYLGAQARKVVAYTVASVSGSILAVCSCTVLPLFAGIYRMGAGIGPASAFLYSGPAINILAIIMTARVLGLEIGIARATGAILFSIVIGLLMHLFFGRADAERMAAARATPIEPVNRSLWQNVLYFALLVGIMITATWGGCECGDSFQNSFYLYKGYIISALAIGLAFILVSWMGVRIWKVIGSAVVISILVLISGGGLLIPFSGGMVLLSIILATSKGEPSDWLHASLGFARQIMPLLFVGILIAGFLLGAPGGEGIIPSGWISSTVGGNTLLANLFASVAGAFMYFATLTEVPILQGLLGAGMGKGPALALLLAGPALSLPNMLVIRSIMGTKRTLVFILLVVIMATISGVLFGMM